MTSDKRQKTEHLVNYFNSVATEALTLSLDDSNLIIEALRESLRVESLIDLVNLLPSCTEDAKGCILYIDEIIPGRTWEWCGENEICLLNRLKSCAKRPC